MTAFFKTTAWAKCILAGEHTVLRGFPALVMPVHHKTMTLAYQSDSCFEIVSNVLELRQAFLNVLQRACGQLGKQLEKVNGRFCLNSHIPMGSGIGFSAALCVVITRWLIAQGWLAAHELFHFAHRLEDLFHGKSSGLDVAGALSDQLIAYTIGGGIRLIDVAWKPLLYLSYSGVPKNTQAAIEKVNSLRLQDSDLGQEIDQQMHASVQEIEQALRQKEGLKLLQQMMNRARSCFHAWGLISLPLQTHLDQLSNLGALAAKPTGAGEGGYVLSLWQEVPPPSSGIDFIPITYSLHTPSSSGYVKKSEITEVLTC